MRSGVSGVGVEDLGGGGGVNGLRAGRRGILYLMV